MGPTFKGYGGIGRTGVRVTLPSGPWIQASVTNGGAPRWRRDGRESFYVSERGNLCRPVDPQASVPFGQRQALFGVLLLFLVSPSTWAWTDGCLKRPSRRKSTKSRGVYWLRRTEGDGAADEQELRAFLHRRAAPHQSSFVTPPHHAPTPARGEPAAGHCGPYLFASPDRFKWAIGPQPHPGFIDFSGEVYHR